MASATDDGSGGFAAGAVPPLSNRGVEDTTVVYGAGAWGRVDHLSLSVFGVSREWLCGVVADEIFGAAGLDAFEGFGDAHVGKARGGEEWVRSLGVDGAFVYSTDRYARVELKGQLCAELDHAQLWSLLNRVHEHRSHVTRVDFAWDGFPASVADVREALIAGRVRTHMRLPSVPPYFENEAGATVYMGSRSSDRLFRVYDARGPVRFELEIKGDAAKSIGLQLRDEDPREWAGIGLAYVRGAADFVEPLTGDSNKSRWPLSSWWAEFVGNAGRARVVRVQKTPPTFIGKVDGFVQRHSRMLRVIHEAGLSEWLADRARHFTAGRWNEDDERAVRMLEAFRGSDFAGLRYVAKVPRRNLPPADESEVPF